MTQHTGNRPDSADNSHDNGHDNKNDNKHDNNHDNQQSGHVTFTLIQETATKNHQVLLISFFNCRQHTAADDEDGDRSHEEQSQAALFLLLLIVCGRKLTVSGFCFQTAKQSANVCRVYGKAALYSRSVHVYDVR